MFLETMHPEVLMTVITGFFTLVAAYFGYLVNSRKNKNEKEVKVKELKEASWEPLVREMKAFFSEQVDHLKGEVDELSEDVRKSNAYKTDVATQIHVQRLTIREKKIADIPEIETWDEWFCRVSNKRG